MLVLTRLSASVAPSDCVTLIAIASKQICQQFAMFQGGADDQHGGEEVCFVTRHISGSLSSTSFARVFVAIEELLSQIAS